MNRILLLLLFLSLAAQTSAQELIANINQTNGGSSPVRLSGSDDLGAFFARPDGGKYEIFYLPAESDSLLRFNTSLPIQNNDIIWDDRLIGDNVYFRSYNSELDEQTIFCADLSEDSLHTVAVLGSNGSTSGLNVFSPFDGTDDVLFVHRNENYTFQLLRTDGTLEGTRFVSDLPDNEFVTRIVSQDGYAYLMYTANFFDDTPAYLYLSDGISAVPVDLPMQTDWGLSARPLGNKVLLSGFGPEGNTHLLASPDLADFRDVSSFPNDTNTSFLRLIYIDNDQLYYLRNGNNHTHEILRTDTFGTSLDTIINLNPDQDSVSYFDYAYDPDTELLYYYGRSLTDGSVTLYRSDLTAAGTFSLTLVQPVGASITNITNSNIRAGGRYYFKAFREATGEEFWVTDGTIEGTHLIVDLVSGTDGADINAMTRVGERVMFTAGTTNFGEEVVITDGNAPGTRLLADINTKEAGANPNRFFTFNDTLFFNADNGCLGRELYKSGGTATSTELVKDQFTGRAGHFSSQPVQLGEHFYYLAYPEESGSSNRLIESDGTAEGTREVFTNLEELGIVSISTPGRVGNDLLLSAYNSVNYQQWVYRYDPETMTVNQLSALNDSGTNGFFSNAAISDSLTIFSARNAAGPALFRTDGTSEGTYALTLEGINSPFSVWNLNAFNGMGYAKVSSNPVTDFIYRTDGTSAGTERLNSSGLSYVRDLFSYNGQPHFFAEEFATLRLFRIDPVSGTISRTGLLNGTQRYIRNIHVQGDTIYFPAETDSGGNELWMIAGPEESAVQIVDLRPGPASSSPQYLTLLNGLLYFTAVDDNNNRDLYVTDGSAAGTVLVRSISGSSTAYHPVNLFAHDSALYYSALDTLMNRELFRYDQNAPTNTGGLEDPNIIDEYCAVPDSIVQVEDQVLDRALSIYPNPTAGQLTISLDNNSLNLELSLSSVEGRQIWKRRFNNSALNVSLGGLPPGLYKFQLVDLETGRKVTRRVLKY